MLGISSRTKAGGVLYLAHFFEIETNTSMNHQKNPPTNPALDPAFNPLENDGKLKDEISNSHDVPVSGERDKYGLRPSAYRMIEPDEFETAMMAEIEKMKAERKTAPFPRNHEMRAEISQAQRRLEQHRGERLVKM